MNKTVIELFAGVGGFRVGLNNITKIDKKGHAIERGPFSIVWSNQWEPSTTRQDAFDCYNIRFPSSHNSNEDIATVNKKDIPNHTLLCGGFPCQDYSVAHSLKNSHGIEGKKGVLWWQINEILKVKKPPFVLLENVDRLLKSPAKQRGRDFGIMLRCLSDLGYAMEYRVINAAEYGFPQRRRRIYIFAYHKSTAYYKRMKSLSKSVILLKEGLFASEFPVEQNNESKLKEIDVIKKYKDLVSLSDKFSFEFENAGILLDGVMTTTKVTPIFKKPIPLKKIVESIPLESDLYLNQTLIKKYEYLRGSKKIKRKDSNGYEYFYSEGSMSPYDSLDLPARTMLTSEGSTNRSTHIIKDPTSDKLRILSPIECERINQFPDNWTNTDMPNKRRYFIMGNALVCGIIARLGQGISSIIDKED